MKFVLSRSCAFADFGTKIIAEIFLSVSAPNGNNIKPIDPSTVKNITDSIVDFYDDNPSSISKLEIIQGFFILVTFNSPEDFMRFCIKTKKDLCDVRMDTYVTLRFDDEVFPDEESIPAISIYNEKKEIPNFHEISIRYDIWKNKNAIVKYRLENPSMKLVCHIPQKEMDSILENTLYRMNLVSPLSYKKKKYYYLVNLKN